MCARRNERASPSSTGARVAEVSPVEIVMSDIRAEPTSAQPPAAASDTRPVKKPSASKASEEAVSAMVKWTKMGCIGAPILKRPAASLRLVTVPPRSLGLAVDDICLLPPDEREDAPAV